MDLRELMELDSVRHRVTRRERETRAVGITVCCLVVLVALSLWGWLIYRTRAARQFPPDARAQAPR